MQTIKAQLKASGVVRNLQAQGDFVLIRAMNGTQATVTTDNGETALLSQGDSIRFDQPYKSLQVSSDSSNDLITLTYGKGWLWPFPLISVFTKMFNGGNPYNLQTKDTVNLNAAPADTYGGGSASPGGFISQVVLTGEEWVSFSLDPATYVSGDTGPLALFTNSNYQSIPPEIIDEKTGQTVSTISSPGTWYKIKTQGGTLLNIPAGTILGNGIGGSFNFALVKGSTTWQDIQPPESIVLNVNDIGGGTLHLSPLIIKPKKAKGFTLLESIGYTQAGLSLNMAIIPQDSNDSSFNPPNVSGPYNLPTQVPGTSYRFGAANDPGAGYPVNSYSTDSFYPGAQSSFFPGSEASLAIPDAFKIAIVDESGVPLKAYTARVVLQWIY